MKIASSDGVAQHGLGAGGDVGEAEPALGVGRRQRPVGGHVGQPHGVQLGQVGQQHRRGVVARPDEAHGQRALLGRRGGPARGRDHRAHGARRGLRHRGRVLQQHPHRGHRARGQALVGRGGLLDRERAGDQGLDLDLLVRQQVKERLDVAPLGPPDVARRVVDALQLVALVVPAGAVGPGEPDVQLLVVVGVPGQVEPGLADVDDPGPVPGQLHRGLDRAVGRAARGQEHVVGAAAAGQLAQRLLDRGDALVGRGGAGGGAGLLGPQAAVLEHVQPDHPDPGRDQQPDHELADQAEADHAGGLAQLRLGPADAVHGDRADGGEGGVLGLHLTGHGHAHVDRDPVVLGVQRVLVPGRGDQLADVELLGALAHLDDHAAERVTERRVGVEPVHHLLVGGHRALLRHRVQDLADLVRPGPGLADHGQLGLGQLHHLRAGGDEREPGLHQHAARPARRRGHVEDAELPGLVVLRYLLHRFLCSDGRAGGCGRGSASARRRPCERALRCHSSSVSSCHSCLERSSRPAWSSAIRLARASRRIIPDPASSPRTSTSWMTSRRSLRTQARSGALNEALGRCTISCGSQLSAACLSATLPRRWRILAAAVEGERRRGHHRVHERGADLDRGGHAGPVGVGQVEAGQEHPGVGQAHPVDLVRQRVVGVDLAVLGHDLVHVAGQVRADQRGQLGRVVERVAAPEPGLLGQLGEGQEALGPARVAQAPARRADRQPADRGPHPGPRRPRAAGRSCWPSCRPGACGSRRTARRRPSRTG